MPSLESSERTPSNLMAEKIHERMKRSTWKITMVAPTLAISLFIVGLQVVDVEDAKFEGADHETRGVDTALCLREEFLNKLVLPLLKTFHTEWHTTQVGDLFLCISESEMTKETLVVLINLIVDKCLLFDELATDGCLQSFSLRISPVKMSTFTSA